MTTDEHGNHLLDETETQVLMELQEWRRGQIIAEWLFHDEYRFKLVREDECDYRPGRERQARYQRKFRLYESRACEIQSLIWQPSYGGQWHSSIRSGYERARYVADCYRRSKLEQARNKRHREMRRIAESLRSHHITEKNRRISR